jgi:superfamily I DNA/RNA helicase
MFTWTSRELDAEQSEAVLEPESVFLIACPGSGKTRTLTYKIAYELSRLESTRHYVIAITYTNRAADEIRERIQGLGVDDSQLWIGTIHSFCLEWIIKPYGIYSSTLSHGYRIIDNFEKQNLLDRFREERPRVRPFDCDYYYTTNGRVLSCRDISRHDDINAVLDAYHAHLESNRLLDFELVLLHASRLLSARPMIGNILSRIFPYVLVDEYQDTKQIQYHIVGQIVRAGTGETRLFMVGDPNQAIYGSLGGYPIGIGELRDLTRVHIVEKELSQNYRSSARVVEYFSHYRVHATRIIAAGPWTNFPSTVAYDYHTSVDNLVHEIAALIRYYVVDAHIPPSEICVLAPQWLHLAAMTRQLVSHVPEYDFDGPGISPLARDPNNFWFKVSRIALTEPSPRAYIRRLGWASEVIAAMHDAGVETSGTTAKGLLYHCNSIAVDEENGLTYLRTFFERLFERIGLVISEFPDLLLHLEAFVASCESRLLTLANSGIHGFEHIAIFRKMFRHHTGITVSTIHGVKGAEYDVVIGYGLLEGFVPNFSDPNRHVSAKNLLYVIGSRARKNLHLFSETGRFNRAGEYEPTTVLAQYAFGYDQT